MDCLEYKGFKGTVEYSKTDNCLCGKIIGVNNDLILYEGATLEELREDFQNGVNNYIAYCKENDIEPHKQYSGTLNVRISPETHSRIALLASKAGISINAFIRKTLDKAVSL